MENETWSIIIGCIVAVVSSAIQSLGITLQRKSHIIHTTVHHKRNMWFFGFLLFITANIFGSLIQITTLPLIILSPLQSIGLIFNSLFSCMLLPGEKFTKKLGFGTIVIALGAFIVAYQGNTVSSTEPTIPHSSRSEENEFYKIVKMLLRKAFLTWFLMTFVIIFVLILAIKFISKKQIIYKQRKSLANSNRLRLRYQVILNRFQFIKGVSYGLISGTLTAHTFLFAKSLIDVIIQTIINSSHKSLGKLFSASNFAPYLLLLIMLAIIGCQLTAFNLGLSQISTAILYPLCFLVYNLVNLINDVIFNSLISEHKMKISQLFWVIFGLGCVFLGVVLISWDSAFGNSTTGQILPINSDDLINQKFPYTDNLSKKMKISNKLYGSLEDSDLPNSRISLESIGSDISKRNFSFEQSQLLSQFINT